MTRFTMILMAIFAFAAVACETTDDANEKIEQCLTDEYGEELDDELSESWELDCDDSEDDCKKCVECIMDTECEDLMGGTCSEDCDSLLSNLTTTIPETARNLPGYFPQSVPR